MGALCWTYNPKDYPESPNLPFIPWDYQLSGQETIESSIGVDDVLIEKSRDMGATWIILAEFFWRWWKMPGQSFLLGSRKEELVEKKGDTRTLFWKLDYMLERMPKFFLPNFERTERHLQNLENGSVIDGEATNDDFGRGDRRTAILLDEFAAVRNGHSVLSATRDTTRTRIFLATPKGAVGAYYDQRKKMVAEKPKQIVRWHWSVHPSKSIGLYIGEDGKYRSPWYDNECSRAATPQEIAQELDIDYVASAWQFFDGTQLESIAAKAREPLWSGEILFDEDGTDPKLSRQQWGRLSLWCPLSAAGVPPEDEYAVTCDIATGTAGECSSQSAATIVSLTKGIKVGRYNSSTIRPREFAACSVAICRLFHNAKLNFEANGPGAEFSRAVIHDTKYRSVYYRKSDDAAGGSKIGWWSTGETKRTLLARYRDALKTGEFTNYDAQAILECREFVQKPDGTVIHQRADAPMNPAGAGDLHGDMVIADAIGYRMVEIWRKSRSIKANARSPAPAEQVGSAWKRIEETRRKDAEGNENYNY